MPSRKNKRIGTVLFSAALLLLASCSGTDSFGPKTTIAYLNNDGSLLKSYSVPYGETADYRGPEPIAAIQEEGVLYQFCGWEETERTNSQVFFVAQYEMCSVGLEIKEGTIVSYSGAATDIYIPSRWEKESITAIAVAAFSKNETMKYVHIKEGTLTTIGSYSFSDCSSLVAINIPPTVNYIGTYVFNNCVSLSSIILPEKLATIGKYTFLCCRSLVTMDIPSKVVSIGEGAFDGCVSLSQISIPDGITSLPAFAFANCTSLKTIPLSEQLKVIEEGCFAYCTGLTSIIIPLGVETMGSLIFYDCKKSTTIYCRATSKPEGWATDWNPSSCSVVWGYKG